MGKRALLFPGQGSQYIGMARDFYSGSSKAKAIVDEADETLGISLSKIMFDGPTDELKQTDITQPAIFLHSVVILKLLQNFNYDMVAGHSLGEYSALVAADVLNWIDALKLVRERGSAMLQCGVEQQGTMAAIIGMPSKEIELNCKAVSNESVVQCANFNSPGQVVISGSVEGVHKAMELCKNGGAKLVKELVVSGAFHSQLMKGAGKRLQKSLIETKFNEASISVYPNVSALPETLSKIFKELLYQQLTSPVRWEETIINMIKDGVDEFVEIGPGKVLQGLVKRIDRSVKFWGIDKFEDLESVNSFS